MGHTVLAQYDELGQAGAALLQGQGQSRTGRQLAVSTCAACVMYTVVLLQNSQCINTVSGRAAIECSLVGFGVLALSTRDVRRCDLQPSKPPKLGITP